MRNFSSYCLSLATVDVPGVIYLLHTGERIARIVSIQLETVHLQIVSRMCRLFHIGVGYTVVRSAV